MLNLKLISYRKGRIELDIKVKYHDKKMPKLEFIGGNKSDWIDVRASKVKVDGKDKSWQSETIERDYMFLTENFNVKYYAGDTVVVDLGISVELPAGYEAHLLPRSSTFKNYGLILTNSMGIVDESYKGENDHWLMSFVAVESGTINKHDRVGQFKVVPKMAVANEEVKFIEVAHLDNQDRGSFGSTGVG